MQSKMTIRSAAALCAMLALSTAPVFAGNNNVLILTQEGTANTISVDQRNANDSQVGGVAFTEAPQLQNSELNVIDLNVDEAGAISNPTLQLGSDNQATITLEGNDSTVFLQQGGDLSDNGNRATINIDSGITGGSLAAILQDGSNNVANTTINGSFSESNILQRGDDNQGRVDIGSSDFAVNNVKASLTQVGNGNNTELQVTGINAGEYSYTVIGDNTSTSVPAVIVTNGASVSITQTSGF